MYSPSEVAALLDIKLPTLRKYSMLLEEKTYRIERNSQNHRYYNDKDIITLRRVIAGSKSGVTLDESISNVLSIQKDNAYTNDADSTLSTHNRGMKELKEMIQQQNGLIEGLTDRLDQQDNYINERLNKHDEILMQSIQESLETKKLIAATKEKRSFFSKLFKR